MKYHQIDISDSFSSISSNSSELFEIDDERKQKKWTKDEDEKLIKLVRRNKEKNWKVIATQIKGKDTLQCFSRYKRLKPGISRGSWKPEEDQQILDLVGKYGKEWSKIARIMVSRNGKQIRDRFINVLDPAVNRSKFTLDEDLLILRLFKQMGPKWASMTNHFDRRSADMIKNRFYSSIKKKMENGTLVVEEEEKKDDINGRPVSTNNSSMINEDLTNSIFNLNFDGIFPQRTVQKKESFGGLMDWNFEEYFVI